MSLLAFSAAERRSLQNAHRPACRCFLLLRQGAAARKEEEEPCDAEATKVKFSFGGPGAISGSSFGGDRHRSRFIRASIAAAIAATAAATATVAACAAAFPTSSAASSKEAAAAEGLLNLRLSRDQQQPTAGILWVPRAGDAPPALPLVRRPLAGTTFPPRSTASPPLSSAIRPLHRRGTWREACTL